MFYEQKLCIFNKNNACLSEKINIDGRGMCDMCQTVSVPENELETLKTNELDALRNYTETQ